jgi:hypothetical protein
MSALFEVINRIVTDIEAGGLAAMPRLLRAAPISRRRRFMRREYNSRTAPTVAWAPETYMTIVPTTSLIAFLQRFAGVRYVFSDFLTSRPETLVYHANAGFRADPYAGCIAALDYLHARYGRTFEERTRNVAMAWGDFSTQDDQIHLAGPTGRGVAQFTTPLKLLYADSSKVVLRRDFPTLSADQIPRYFMQARFGTTFTKSKAVRVYSYFCDAILFPDGALWREG